MVGDLVAGEPLPAMPEQIGNGSFGIAAPHHRGDGPAPPISICHTDHASIFHRRVPVQHSLDLSWVDVLSTGDDQIVPTIDNVEVPFIVHVTGVTGLKPPAGARSRGSIFGTDVSGEEGRPPNLDRTYFTGRCGSARRNDPDLCQRERTARRIAAWTRLPLEGGLLPGMWFR